MIGHIGKRATVNAKHAGIAEMRVAGEIDHGLNRSPGLRSADRQQDRDLRKAVYVDAHKVH